MGLAVERIRALRSIHGRREHHGLSRVRHGDRRPPGLLPLLRRTAAGGPCGPPPLGGAVPLPHRPGDGGGDAVVGVAGGEGLRSCAGGGYMDTPRYGHAGRHPRRTLRIVCMGQGPGAPPAGRRKSARRAV